MMTLLITTPYESHARHTTSIGVITDGKHYTFFPGHSDTALLLRHATLEVEDPERITYFIELGICTVHENKITCLAPHITQLKPQ